MESFEYYSLISECGDDSLQELNKLGRAGWELVSVVPCGVYLHFYFKRVVRVINERPNLSPTAKYTVGQAAEILGFSRRHILNLAKCGMLRYSVSSTNGRKMFLGRDLVAFWQR